ncbi:hypothetical protein Celaphus_00000474 [Cervus elaphus hippelaphus]|uniref:Uncharacterized protein n=1 Tax=Cervus elaphus hippelaphus TaxID=46360 RepID=A0A212D9L9_CEREH|nr:hypothetical protein Celaphus_00000474 [Cervus elaphus hippelaphus]
MARAKKSMKGGQRKARGPGLGTFLAGSPGAQVAVATRPDIQILCVARNLQPPGGIPGEEVTLYTVEAVEDSGALVNGEEAEIRWECQLLAEDIMEEVEVVADKEQEQQSSQELEEKTVEEQGLKRHGGLSEQPVLDVLQSLAALQMELRSEHEKNHWAYVSFMLKNHHSRKCHLAWRSAIIQGIADFWINAVSLLLLVGVHLLGGEGGGAEARGCVRVRAQEGRWRSVKEVWSWTMAGSKGTAK